MRYWVTLPATDNAKNLKKVFSISTFPASKCIARNKGLSHFDVRGCTTPMQASVPQLDDNSMFISSPAPLGRTLASSKPKPTTASTVDNSQPMSGTSSSHSVVVNLVTGAEELTGSQFLRPDPPDASAASSFTQTVSRYVPGKPTDESTVRQFAHYNPEILGDVVARDISLPEYAFNTDPAEVLAPRSNWQPPPVPFIEDWTNEGEDVRTYEAQSWVSISCLSKENLSKVELRHISIGLIGRSDRLVVECSEPPDKIGATHEERTRAYLEDFKTRKARRRDKHREMIARLSSTLRHRETLSGAERLAAEVCELHSLMQTAHDEITTEHDIRLAAQEELRTEVAARGHAEVFQLTGELERLKNDLVAVRALQTELRKVVDDLRDIHAHTGVKQQEHLKSALLEAATDDRQCGPVPKLAVSCRQ
eukprot:gene25076-32699_t